MLPITIGKKKNSCLKCQKNKSDKKQQEKKVKEALCCSKQDTIVTGCHD